ncbi:MAG: PQQ-dependent sugar dehydrogenase [Candidatus Sumerlaeia bacterium]|nr:PQQ-dependent sugar dehydrogenase [Candidatus Sumerlaeia bacterium]
MMQKLSCFAAAVLAAMSFAVNQPLAGEPHGLVRPRASNNDLVINTLPQASLGEITLIRAFPRLGFIYPVQLLQAPEDNSRFFVVTQGGVIYAFPNAPDPSPDEVEVFLDLSAEVCTAGEAGMLSMAFQPDYATSGKFLVYYVNNTPACGPSFFEVGSSILERFTNDAPSGSSVNLASREVILEVPQTTIIHKGGQLAFGLDDMLYLSVGDGGGLSSITPPAPSQDLSSLLGKILRIDLLSTPAAGLNYSIPPDNPFTDTELFGPETRREIFAYGLRNPWRFSISPLSGRLFAGDVGADLYEEINLIEAGRNYGWPVVEGMDCTGLDGFECNPANFVPPITGYGHEPGNNAIIGPVPYLGSEFPDLYGTFVYADFSGRIYGFRFDGAQVTANQLLCAFCGIDPIGMGRGHDGEVYLLDAGWGSPAGVYVIRPNGMPTQTDLPHHLSSLPALLQAGSGNGHLVPGVIPYRPSSQLWSDGAIKERYVAMPGLGTITRNNERGWDFPEKTILIKNFSIPLDDRDPQGTAQRIETRIMVKDGTNWQGYSYEWNESETDAVLLTSSKARTFVRTNLAGEAYTYNWHYPNAAECRACHTVAQNQVLGLETAALNSDFLYPASGIVDNQLEAMDWVSLFDAPLESPVADLPRMPDYRDATAPLRDRARAYLAANCAMCHQPGGPAPVQIDLRWATADEDAGLLNLTPQSATLGIENARIVAPGSPERSVLLARMATRDAQHQMPPLATSLVDEEAVQIVSDWIASLPKPSDQTGWMLY